MTAFIVAPADADDSGDDIYDRLRRRLPPPPSPPPARTMIFRRRRTAAPISTASEDRRSLGVVDSILSSIVAYSKRMRALLTKRFLLMHAEGGGRILFTRSFTKCPTHDELYCLV